MELSKIKLEELKPASYNPRKISSDDYKKLQRSIEEYGVVDPIVINTKTKTILAGHQRFDVLYHNSPESEVNILKLGDISWVFPHTDLKIKDENHEKALNVALNHISGEWDISKLTPLLDELAELNLGELTGFDLELEEINYDFVDIPETVDVEEDESEEERNYDSDSFKETVEEISEEILTQEPYEYDEEIEMGEETISEETVELTPQKRFVQYGDIYKINNNFIMCGDYEDKDEVKLLLNKKIQETSLNNYDLKLITTEKVNLNFYSTINPKVIEKIIQENKDLEILKL